LPFKTLFSRDNTSTGNGKLIEKIMQLCGVEKEYAVELASLSFQDDYGSLSAKAIKRILPYSLKPYFLSPP